MKIKGSCVRERVCLCVRERYRERERERERERAVPKVEVNMPHMAAISGCAPDLFHARPFKRQSKVQLLNIWGKTWTCLVES